MTITFLGTGTSHGVPSIDCMLSGFKTCPKGVCRESLTDAKHNRTRCSVTVEVNGAIILIDVSADFRQQILRERISRIDAVLLTHNHADHIAGLPDIRSFTRTAPLPVYGSDECLTYVEQAFTYIFTPPENRGGGIPDIVARRINGPFEVAGIQAIPLPVVHGSLKECLGYRIGDFAYIPDAKEIPPETMALLEGVECLVLDSLRDTRPHSTHLILPESMAIARALHPDVCYFTHLCHDIHYMRDAALLEPWMAFAYDGLTVDV